MAFPHPYSRNDHYRKKDKPGSGSVAWKFFKRAVNVAEYRNSNDDVNPAKNRSYGALVHDDLDSLLELNRRFLSRRLKADSAQLIRSVDAGLKAGSAYPLTSGAEAWRFKAFQLPA
jgi:hypothetical protein